MPSCPVQERAIAPSRRTASSPPVQPSCASVQPARSVSPDVRHAPSSAQPNSNSDRGSRASSASSTLALGRRRGVALFSVSTSRTVASAGSARSPSLSRICGSIAASARFIGSAVPALRSALGVSLAEASGTRAARTASITAIASSPTPAVASDRAR
jgi:hypothetical protein